ncbi:MAG: Gfo/Idh/MocA family oxidoreductase [Microthrixaceae bacterium]
MTPIGVGVIGASPEVGWAAHSHLPALRALAEFDLTAVATTRQESADLSAQIFGAKNAFANAEELVAHPDVDLVVVAVNVPQHAGLVQLALEGGKDVVCDWPLARNTAEARELVEAVGRSGRSAWTMLQGRFSPPLAELRRLVEEGFVGRVTSVVVHSTTGMWGGPNIAPRSVYQLDVSNGADLLAITGGHTIDSVCFALGGLKWVSSHSVIQYPQPTLAGTDETRDSNAPDLITMVGEFTNGAALLMHLHSGQQFGATTYLEVVGTDGSIRLDAPESPPPGLHRSGLLMRGATRGDAGPLRELQPDPAPSQGGLSEPAARVSLYYQGLARRILTGSGDDKLVDFVEAVRLHEALDAVRKSGLTPFHLA